MNDSIDEDEDEVSPLGCLTGLAVAAAIGGCVYFAIDQNTKNRGKEIQGIVLTQQNPYFNGKITQTRAVPAKKGGVGYNDEPAHYFVTVKQENLEYNLELMPNTSPFRVSDAEVESLKMKFQEGAKVRFPLYRTAQDTNYSRSEIESAKIEPDTFVNFKRFPNYSGQLPSDMLEKIVE